MYNFKLKAIKKLATEILEVEAEHESYLQMAYIKEYLIAQLLRAFEQNKVLQESLSKKMHPDKQEVALVLGRLLEEDKERMQKLLKILMPLIESKKITDVALRQEIIVEVRKSIDSTNQAIEKDIVKQIFKRLLHHIKEQSKDQ